MEKLQREFRIITHFAVEKTETINPKFDNIERLSLEIGSELPKGRFCLKLTKPFPPYNRGGEKLKKLRSLRCDDIEYIQAFRNPDSNGSARIEIYMKKSDPNMVVRCERIEGVPDWDEKQIDNYDSAVGRIT